MVTVVNERPIKSNCKAVLILLIRVGFTSAEGIDPSK